MQAMCVDGMCQKQPFGSECASNDDCQLVPELTAPGGCRQFPSNSCKSCGVTTIDRSHYTPVGSAWLALLTASLPTCTLYPLPTPPLTCQAYEFVVVVVVVVVVVLVIVDAMYIVQLF
jgi:hypothetical protein